MKRLSILFGIVSALALGACNDDENDSPEYSIVGEWQPVQMTETNISNTTSESQNFTFNDCEKQSRWIFRDDETGNETMKREVSANNCAVYLNKNFTYDYDAVNSTIQFTSPGIPKDIVEQGKITNLTETTMNVIVYDVNNNGHSYTYAMKRIK